MVAANVLALVTPLVDTIQRKCKVARISPSGTGLQILASQSLNQPITMRVSYTYDNTVIGQYKQCAARISNPDLCHSPSNYAGRHIWLLDWNAHILLPVTSSVLNSGNLSWTAVNRRPISQPKLFTCVALVCTICGLMLDATLTIFIGEMAGLIKIPHIHDFWPVP